MKVLVINKFLYSRGGDSIYSLNVGKMLWEEGHDVKYYAMQYPLNIELPDRNSFAKEVSFSDTNLYNRFEAASRIFGFGIKKTFVSLLDEYQPDIVHLNNIHSYLSPILARIAHKKGIKVIWTLHDYKLICPTYSCMNRGKSCELCFDNKFSVISRKCHKNSYSASILAYLEAIYWNRKKLAKWVDHFICPSRFMADKMIENKYPEEKITVLNNFIDAKKVALIQSITEQKNEKAYCYVGRLSQEKGVEDLLQVASQLPYTLYIAGDGPLADALRRKYESDRIVFLGFQTEQDIISLLKKVQFSVMPSICYENNPLSVIESLCCGTPVLGSNIGGIPELIKENDNGRLFEPGNQKDMKDRIEMMFKQSVRHSGEQISKEAIDKFSWNTYYNQLLTLYNKKNQ